MIFLRTFGIEDLIRDTFADSINFFEKQKDYGESFFGIKIKMISDDYLFICFTAAEKLSIIS